MLNFDLIRREVPLLALANKRYKLGWPDHGRAAQIHCPFHEDRTPSARYYSDERGGYCWSCQSVIDPISLVASLEQCSNGQAAALLMEWYGIDARMAPEQEELRALLRTAAEEPEDRQLSDREEADLRRAAGVSVRMVGHPWTPALLDAYDELDVCDADPRAWVATARSTLAIE